MQQDIEELLIASLGWIPTRLGMAMRLLCWKALFAECGTVRFGRRLTLEGCSTMHLSDSVRLGLGVQLYARNGRLELGEETALSPGVVVDASDGLVRLGKQVAVGPGTIIRAANHRFDRRDLPIMHQGHQYGEVVVEDDVWIAAQCVLTPGSRVCQGAVIGAGAVVTGEIPPFSIAAGVPAKIIGHR